MDNTAPVFVNPPANITADCANLPDADEITAIDACSEVNVTVEVNELLFSGGCAGVIQRIWTAIDACGNVATHEQYITLIDTVAPVLNGLPEDVAYECGDDIPAPAVVTATDNCDEAVAVAFEESIETGNCPQSYTIYRTWFAMDHCDNTVSHTQVITISDELAPVFDNAPENITVSCNEVPEVEMVSATDNCTATDNIELTFNEEISEGCPYTITRTWTATDECGNTASHTQIITVVDEEAPVLSSYPGDITVSCESIPTPAIVIATDNCDPDVIVNFSETDFEGCAGTITRTWTAVDVCGNSTIHVQTITVVDETAPVFNEMVEDMTAECDAIPAIPAVTASDNCDVEVAMAYNETTEPGECEGQYTLIRTWTATDDCGNSSTLTQTIEVEDTTPPVFVNVPEDETYVCTDDIPTLEDLIATDNCSSTITYTAEEFIEGYTGEDGLQQCILTTPMDVVGAAWALWLPNQLGEPQYYHLTADGGMFTELSGGNAHLTGTVYSPTAPNKQWIIDVYFEGGYDWATWDAMGRSYKDDAYVAGDNYLDWTFYILNADSAVLTGAGDYEGTSLNLTHAPTSQYFGFQVGLAANNRNAANGSSGWFFYEGLWMGNEANGIGDFGFEQECIECDYTITRIWTATDDCGNSTSAMQVITVQPGDSAEGEENLFEHPSTGLSHLNATMTAWPNPTISNATIAFELREPSNQVVLEILDQQGKVLQTLYRGNANPEQVYQFNFERGDLNSGLYTYRLTTDSDVYIEKLMLTR